VKALAVTLISATAGLHFTASYAQGSKDIDALVDRLAVAIDTELNMLGFIRTIVETASAITPNCSEAPPGRWSDPSGELIWDADSTILLRKGITQCEDDYGRLYGYIESRVPEQLELLQIIVQVIETEIAANQEAFLSDLISDERGVSYSCATIKATTALCHDASLERTK
jgi:hypothetical protein